MNATSNRTGPDEVDLLIGAALKDAREFAQAADFPDAAGPFAAGRESAWRPPSPDSFTGYQIVREIHRGGQGIVYHAVHEATDRDVAIKVLRDGPFAGTRELARFEREVSILREFEHPNVVTVLDVGAVGDQPYVVMPYVEGRPLDAYVAEQGLNLRETLELFAVVCEAVNEAHLHGVIHRDIKPSNVRVDDDGRPHVLDFGLAKLCGVGSSPLHGVGSSPLRGEGLGGSPLRGERPPCSPPLNPPMPAAADAGLTITESGQFVGSLPWTSPEQAAGLADVDVRTDVYSLGVVLFRLLTGRFPYDVDGSIRDVLDRIIDAAPVRPRTLSRRIDADVETIILKCLCKERPRRYQSAGDLAADLRRYLAGQAIEARRESFTYVAWRFVRRNRLSSSLAAALVLSLLTGVPALVALWRQTVGESNRAEAQQHIAEANAEEARNMLVDLLNVIDPATRGGRPTPEALTQLNSAIAHFNAMTDAPPEFRRVVHVRLIDIAVSVGAVGQAYELSMVGLRVAEKEHGADSEAALDALARCAMTTARIGDHAAVQRYAARVLLLAQQLYGENDMRTASYCDGASRAFRLMGAARETDEYARRALAVARNVLRTDTESMGMKALAETLHHSLRADTEAEELQRRALAAAQRERGGKEGGQEYVAHHQNSFAVLLCDMGRLDEAEQLAREALATRRAVYQPGDWYDFYIYASGTVLGVVLTRQGDFAEAEGLLLEAYQGLARHPFSDMRQYEGEAADALVKLYESWDAAEPGTGYAENAKRWRALLPPAPESAAGVEPDSAAERDSESESREESTPQGGDELKP